MASAGENRTLEKNSDRHNNEAEILSNKTNDLKKKKEKFQGT